jgi:hypothetical protein
MLGTPTEIDDTNCVSPSTTQFQEATKAEVLGGAGGKRNLPVNKSFSTPRGSGP